MNIEFSAAFTSSMRMPVEHTQYANTHSLVY